MELYLKIAGILLIVLAVHSHRFPPVFQMEKELSLLSLINRQMMYVHSFFIRLCRFANGRSLPDFS
jgi:hypothetical protein